MNELNVGCYTSCDKYSMPIHEQVQPYLKTIQESRGMEQWRTISIRKE